MATIKNNFKFRSRKGVVCPRVQVDVLSYEPLSKRIERFLSGDASSLEGADTTKAEYDEPEKAGEDFSVFEPGEVRDDLLNQPLDNLDIAEIRCDANKVLNEKSAVLNQKKMQQLENQDQPAQSQSAQAQPAQSQSAQAQSAQADKE